MFDEKKGAIRITTHYSDFNGNLQEWKYAFYDIWRYQMTWDFAYEISLRESRKNGVFLDLLVKECFKQNAIDLLDELGYMNISTSEENVGIVYEFEHEEFNDGFWTLVLEQ